MYIQRAKYEMNALEAMGFEGYYLMVHSYVNAAKRRGIARGSGGGSLLAYLCGIVDIDPIKYGLYFEFEQEVKGNDVISFVTKSGATTINPSIIYGEVVENSLHFDFVNEKFPNGSERHIGDVHPFYYNGKIYMYYLKTVFQ